MEYLVKFGIVSCLVVAVYGRALSPEECNCDRRFYQHYVSKGCQESQTDSCGCPISYVCSPKNESKGCMYHGVAFKLGERIQVDDRCQSCRCVDSADPHIVCRQRECPQLDPVQGDNCHPVFEENKCCPTGYECVGEGANNAVPEGASVAPTCTYGNVTYPFGAKIRSAEDPCQVCRCDENWNGMDNATCYVRECIFERSQRYLNAGCIPVYHESKCCPIEYYCPDVRGNTGFVERNDSQDEGTTERESDSGSCLFGGTSYAVGESLPVNNTCVRCSCVVPPDVTCVHQSCPPPPNAENCYEFYTADQCCPVYDCALGDNADEEEEVPFDDYNSCPTPMCADETCIIGIKEGHHCPTCICDEANCPTPMCEEECTIGIEPGRKCPTCICNDTRERNELEPPSQPSLDSQYMEVGEGPEGSQGLPEEDKFVEELSPKSAPQVPLEDTEGKGEPEETNREFFSESFAGELHHKEKNALENIFHAESEDRESESAFQKFEVVKEEIVMDPNSTNVEALEGQKLSNEIRRKRSENSQTGLQMNQWSILQQDSGGLDSSETSEREVESSNEDSDGYSEVKVLRPRESNFRTSADMLTLDDNEYNNVIWRTIVPGCPTPMCADSTCKIGVPPGRSCPTCICKKRRQP